jgi:hypothetical protein
LPNIARLEQGRGRPERDEDSKKSHRAQLKGHRRTLPRRRILRKKRMSGGDATEESVDGLHPFGGGGAAF